jgi:CBS domain-containing protein
VNVAVAAVLLGILWLAEVELGFELEEVTEARTGWHTFLRELIAINGFLAAFNLIPAFPMDGGRILRSLLALKLSYTRATRVAATVGQGFAMLFGLYGLMIGHWLLVLIAVFVFMGAAGEAAAAQLQELFRGLPASSAILREFKTLGPEDTLSAAVERLLGGSQVDFPVADGDRVLGILTRQKLVASLKEGGPSTIVREIELAPVEAIEDGTPLFQAWEALQRQGVGCLPVRSAGSIVGWITRENIAEVAMVREALALGGYSRGG